jgi:protein-S-isoprenylcysteine O-methyltransferase Ste14
MSALELKIPLPAVALVMAGAMWAASVAAPMAYMPDGIRLFAGIAFAIAGIATALSGVIAFRRARTTVNPLKPETSSSLVTSGIYRFTRNPMYVGLALVLLGWAVFLPSVWTLLGPLVFAFYMTRFQIVPEERTLMGLFGATYSEYQARVRRWI